jgi:hypothetical protein
MILYQTSDYLGYVNFFCFGYAAPIKYKNLHTVLLWPQELNMWKPQHRTANLTPRFDEWLRWIPSSYGATSSLERLVRKPELIEQAPGGGTSLNAPDDDGDRQQILSAHFFQPWKLLVLSACLCELSDNAGLHVII